MSYSRERTLAWLAFGLCMGMTVVGALFQLAAGIEPELPFRASLTAFPIVAISILSRQPRNAIGWILLGIGIAWNIGIVGDYGDLALVREWPGGAAAAAIGGPMWAPPIGLMGTTLLLRFPDGKLPSPRWRVVELMGVTALAVTVTAILLAPGPIEEHPNVTNPFGIDHPIVEASVAAIIGIPISILLSAVALVLRFRRSRGTQRLQMKWLATAAALVAVVYGITMVASLTAPWGTSETPRWLGILQWVAVGSFSLIPISIGFAILRYRLYDIDVVINKALVFGALATFVTAVYVAIVAGVGEVLGSRGNVALSIAATAVVALAFQPVKRTVQAAANRVVYGKRLTPYEALSTFSTRMAAAHGDVMQRMAEVVAYGSGAARATVWRNERDGAVQVGSHPDAEPASQTRIDVRHRGDLLGWIAIDKPRGEAMTDADRALLEGLAAQAGIVMHNLALNEQLRDRLEQLRGVRARLVKAQDQERHRIERDLHDGAQQELVALAVGLGLAVRIAEADPARDLLEQVRARTSDTLERLRELAHGIYPPLLAAEGLGAALRSVASRAQVPVELDVAAGRHPAEVEATIYFSVAEALRDAEDVEATRARVQVREGSNGVSFVVVHDRARAKGSTRFVTVRDRIDALGGTIQVETADGGTTVQGVIPTTVQV